MTKKKDELVPAKQEEQKDLELQSEVRDNPIAEGVSESPSETPGEDTPAGTPQSSSEPPAPSPEDVLADKAVNKIIPVIQARFEEVAAKIPKPEEINALIEAKLKAILEPLIKAKEEEPIAAAGDSGGLKDLAAVVRELRGVGSGNQSNPFEAMKPFFEWMTSQWQALNNAQQSGVNLATGVMMPAIRAGVEPADAAKNFLDHWRPNPPISPGK